MWYALDEGLCFYRAQISSNSQVSEGWTVRCVCGATGDDGKVMAECDTCKIWQHVKCALGKRAKLAPGDPFLCTFCREAPEEDAPSSPAPAQVCLH